MLDLLQAIVDIIVIVETIIKVRKWWKHNHKGRK